METKKKEINWKEGVARLYNVCWAGFAAIVFLFGILRSGSGEETTALLFLITIIPYTIKHAGKWVYQGFVKK